MRKWITNAIEEQDIAVLLFPRFSNLCLANAIEPLRAANGILAKEFYRWHYVTLNGEAVESSSGLPVLPNGTLHDHPGGKHLFILASYDVQKFATHATSRALSAAAKRFETIVGMDTSAWLMAQAGLLEGSKATIHWDEFTAFSEAFDNIEATTERFVINENDITCGGAMATFDLVLDLIRHTHGEALGLDISSFFLHQSHPEKIPQNSIFKKHASPLVERCIAIMSTELEAPLPIATIAKRAQTTQRKMARAFYLDLGAAPITVYKHLRLATARRYAQQSSYSITETALRCGYKNAAAMTRAFVAEYGRPPSTFRQKK